MRLYLSIETCATIEKCVPPETCPMALYLKDSMDNSEDPEKQTESEFGLTKKKCFIPRSNTTEKGFCCANNQAFQTNDQIYKDRLLAKFSKLLYYKGHQARSSISFEFSKAIQLYLDLLAQWLLGKLF